MPNVTKHNLCTQVGGWDHGIRGYCCVSTHRVSTYIYGKIDVIPCAVADEVTMWVQDPNLGSAYLLLPGPVQSGFGTPNTRRKRAPNLTMVHFQPSYPKRVRTHPQ